MNKKKLKADITKARIIGLLIGTRDYFSIYVDDDDINDKVNVQALLTTLDETIAYLEKMR